MSVTAFKVRLAQRRQAGDTLIEVLFAFAVLSLVIIGALSIMNQGTIAAQRSLETTLVREQVDGQATTLRFLHDAYVAQFSAGGTPVPGSPAAQWAKMVGDLTATTPSTITGSSTCPKPSSDSFVLDPVTATYEGVGVGLQPAQTYAQLVYNTSGVFTESDGVWVQGILSTDVQTDPNKQNTSYIDFHINACWPGPGSGPPMTIGTVVRLYEPLK
jgi:type II secretory pathway pseudopilin PulG